jgi:hypothetical protein
MKKRTPIGVTIFPVASFSTIPPSASASYSTRDANSMASSTDMRPVASSMVFLLSARAALTASRTVPGFALSITEGRAYCPSLPRQAPHPGPQTRPPLRLVPEHVGEQFLLAFES